jgi:hypothetical protein
MVYGGYVACVAVGYVALFRETKTTQVLNLAGSITILE